MNLSVEIVRFVDNHQPGWVEVQFVDANGTRHIIVDKVPIFTVALLDESSAYPQPGTLPCEVASHWLDGNGRSMSSITTRRFGIESAVDESNFIVLSGQLSG